MEISPIREIRAVGAASTPKADSEIQPAFAFDPAARMEDDAYNGNDRAPERGVEEDLEQAEEAVGDDQSVTLPDDLDSKTEVNFFV